jgi:hypothetical protein
VVPGRWEKVAAENLGSKFTVTMLSGERIDGYYKGFSEDRLNLMLLDGKERLVPKADVAKIITAENRPDGLLNGFLIGIAIGAGIPGIAAASLGEGDELVVLAILLYGLLGGAIGAGVDAMIQGHTTLYQAPKR